MLRLIYRQLLYDPVRTLFTVLAIGAVISLMLVLDGFQQGLYRQLRMAVLDRGADLIVSQAGVSNMIAARSTIPQLDRLDVEAIGGVKNAYPLTSLSVIYEQNGRKNPVYIFVYDKKGGPPALSRGGYINGPRQIIIDRTLAKLYHLSPGDPFVVNDFKFKVAGIAKNSAALFTPFAFMSFDDLIDFYMESDIAADISTFPLLSYLLVELEPGAGREAVARAIEDKIPDVDVFTPEALARNDVQLGRELFGPILGLLRSIGYIIGLLAVGIVMFTTAHARKRSLAVMRALGFSTGKVAAAVTLETAVLILLAYPAGVVLARGIAAVIPRISPLYLVLPTEPVTLLHTLVACVALSLLGALIALAVIARIEPGIAFRS